MPQRVFLQFQRTATVVEKGAVAIDVNLGDTIQQIYKRALNKEFKEFLIEDREYIPDTEKWEFEIMKEAQDTNYDGDNPFSPDTP